MTRSMAISNKCMLAVPLSSGPVTKCPIYWTWKSHRPCLSGKKHMENNGVIFLAVRLFSRSAECPQCRESSLLATENWGCSKGFCLHTEGSQMQNVLQARGQEQLCHGTLPCQCHCHGPRAPLSPQLQQQVLSTPRGPGSSVGMSATCC